MKLSIGKTAGDLGTFVPVETNSIENLKSIITKENYSLGQFKNSKRNLANFESAEAIGLDFDDGMSLSEAKELFKNYTHIIATTKSHGKEKNGKVSDRFRVILKLAQPITDVETFEATWFELAKRFPACDRACKDASRFFYPSVDVVSVNTTGEKVEPVAPVDPEPWPVGDIDLSELPSWQKGKLARTTLDFLEKGTLEEGRNNTVHKVARDFNQSLYSEDEAMHFILDALNRHSIIANDFPEHEATAAIRSAYAKEAKHPPRLETKAFKWQQIGQFMRDAKATSWLVDGLLSHGGMSVIAGPPKSGKSTLVRQLAKAVCNGTEFLGRKCKKGPVLHIALEEQEETLKDTYKAVGIGEEDKLFLHVGGVYEENFIQDLKTDLLHMRPSLLIIDTLFLLAHVESSNDYSQVNAAMTPYRRLARETDTHVLFVHHTRKGGGGAESISGSQAIHGAVDCALILNQDGNKRRLQTSQRGGRPFMATSLEFNPANQTYSLGRELEDFE
jgi:hypothetical protein